MADSLGFKYNDFNNLKIYCIISPTDFDGFKIISTKYHKFLRKI